MWMPNGPQRTASQSLCAQEENAACAFHLHEDNHRAISVKREINDAAGALRGSLIERASVHGQFIGQIRRAAAGKLRHGKEDAAELKPVRRNPVLWEIVWKIKKQGEYRLYHSEQSSEPLLVGLRFHRKDTSGFDADTIKNLQNAEMDEAGTRYTQGMPTLWGHEAGCTTCIKADSL